MINVTALELESILATVDKALAMHGQWQEQLQRTLICKLPPLEADLADDSHQLCAFGQWYYSAGNTHLHRLPVFKQIEGMHTAMHTLARDLCIRLKGRWAITPKEYDPFIAGVAEFREELIKLRSKVEETLHKIDPLTGAFRRNQLLPDLRQEQSKQRATGQPYSLLLLRFDLSEINRVHGHEAGDKILRTSITGSRDILDAGENIYRYIGTEFIFCLPGKAHKEGEATRKKLLESIAQTLATPENSIASTALQVHYGIVELEPDAYMEELIHAATLATYTIQM